MIHSSLNFVVVIPLYIVLGHFSGGGTPVLIPNTEVKSSSAYGTLGFTYGRVGRGQEH